MRNNQRRITSRSYAARAGTTAYFRPVEAKRLSGDIKVFTASECKIIDLITKHMKSNAHQPPRWWSAYSNDVRMRAALSRIQTSAQYCSLEMDEFLKRAMLVLRARSSDRASILMLLGGQWVRECIREGLHDSFGDVAKPSADTCTLEDVKVSIRSIRDAFSKHQVSVLHPLLIAGRSTWHPLVLYAVESSRSYWAQIDEEFGEGSFCGVSFKTVRSMYQRMAMQLIHTEEWQWLLNQPSN